MCNLFFLSLLSPFLPFVTRQIGEANKSEIRNRTRLMSRHFLGTASLNKWIAISTAWLRCHFRWVSIISCGSVYSGSCRLLSAARQNSRDSHCGKDTPLHPSATQANPSQPLFGRATTMTTVCTLYEAHHYEAAMVAAHPACLATAIIIRHLNNFRFHAATLSPATRRLARLPTLDG